jgi:hypothetical protein
MSEPEIRPDFAATMMASVPFRDIQLMTRLILDHCPEAPRLPIMTRSFRWMYEGLPCLHIDREKKQIYMVPPEERESEVLEFYDRVEAEDLDFFITSQETAPFYYQIVEELQKAAGPEMKWIGVQFPGPFILGDTFRQTNGMPVSQHDTLLDIVIKCVAMKTRWLENMLKQAFPNARVIVDHPEPTLVGFTSSQGYGSRERVINCMNEAFIGVQGLRWVHCCSNIDWSLLTQADIDVINFDAYEHADKVALYGAEIQHFLEKGGTLGWGIVPVREDIIVNEDSNSLSDRLLKGFDLMVKQGVNPDLLARSSWVLTSCETSLLSPEQAEYAFLLTHQVSEKMRQHFGL